MSSSDESLANPDAGSRSAAWRASSSEMAMVASDGSMSSWKIIGAASVGNLVVFAPFNADVVGVYDVATDAFD
eukprot:5467779-Prymnesium_polylepis.1